MGPTFGGEDWSFDLSAKSEPFNGDGNCVSNPNQPNYAIPLISSSGLALPEG